MPWGRADSSPDEPDYYDYDDALPAGCTRLHAYVPAGEPSLAPASDFQMVLLDGATASSLHWHWPPSLTTCPPPQMLTSLFRLPAWPGRASPLHPCWLQAKHLLTLACPHLDKQFFRSGQCEPVHAVAAVASQVQLETT